VLILKQKRKTVRDISEALYYFLVREELQAKIKKQEIVFEENGELALAKEYAQIYRVVLELLDKFVSLLGEENISVREYAELLDAGMEEARIGVIPPGVDEVVIGDIERTRVKDIKALILMGVNDLSNINNYISYLNSKASTWTSNGANVYFVSVNPTNGSYSHMTNRINSFNNQIRSLNGVKYIDTNSYLNSVGFTATDGLHYDKATYKKIYDHVVSNL